jgi:hypothetical protein
VRIIPNIFKQHELPDDITLGEARAWLLDRVEAGACCPVCTQLAKVYDNRQINAGMAVSLIKMYRVGGTDWVHVPTMVGARSREEGKLAYWDLVEEATEKRPDGGRAGWWRITPRGERFTLNELRVPKYARVYDNRVLGFRGEPISIVDALKNKFDYNELMGR